MAVIHLRNSLFNLHLVLQSELFCNNAEAHRVLVETDGDHALSEITYRDYFRRSKNNNFDVKDRELSGTPNWFKGEKLEALLHGDSCQMLGELAESLGVDYTIVSKCLKILGMIQRQGYWVPYELKQRDVEQRLFTCEAASTAKKETFFASYRDEKWIRYDNPKRTRS